LPQLKEERERFHIGQIINKMGLLLVLVIFVLIMTILTPSFMTWNNIRNLLVQSTVLATLSLGVTFVIITGGIDLSVGSVEAFSAAIGLDLIVNHNVPIPLGIIIILLIGLGFGLLNGVSVTLLGIPPMIATLATMSIARGAVLVYTNSANIYAPESFSTLTSNYFLGLPYIVWLVAILAVVAWLLLSKTVFGRSVYAVGGNELAAKLAGIRTKRVVTLTYMISGLTAAIAGILLTVRLESAGPNAGDGVEMNVIAAVVIGGTSLFGGRGTIIGTIVGMILITLISNAVNLLGVPPSWDKIVKGVVIFCAALYDASRNRLNQQA